MGPFYSTNNGSKTLNCTQQDEEEKIKSLLSVINVHVTLTIWKQSL